MKKLLCALFLLFIVICFKANSQNICNTKNLDTCSAFADIKIISYKKYNTVYDINATYYEKKIRILSPKTKCKKGIRLKKGETYSLMLEPVFQQNDSIVSLIIPDYIVINNANIPFFNGFSTCFYKSKDLDGLYYLKVDVK